MPIALFTIAAPPVLWVLKLGVYCIHAATSPCLTKRGSYSQFVKIDSSIFLRITALVTPPNGQPLNKGTLRLRFEAARTNAVQKAASDGDVALSTRISNFQFRDIRAKAATEIADISDASKLLGHTEQEITKKVYRRLGEEVKPTR